MRTARSVVVVLALVGCGQPAADPGPSCTVVMTHLATVMSQGIAGHEGLFGGGKQDIAECKARMLTAEQRRCLVATKTMADIAACKAGQTRVVPPPGSAQPPPMLPTTKR
ncbi:MAG: hypothetical protein NT062_22115 [Proteobacteria bacterium]|nr:hypothetical protein [Pseudomonadota bacterium]